MKIDWHGNVGYWFPDPGAVQSAVCGVCNSPMRVKRNVLGPTSWAMAMGGAKRLHDSFMCPHYQEAWHEQINRLKMDIYRAEVAKSPDLKKRKAKARKEIIKILKKHKPR
ncbi:MAG: hypothetical protein KGI60_00625 [Patescibacteria group bacterium]|nr:hypothetical protein [Patescibacteria group bacterium]